ncbi:hypothetical protein CHN50_02450 [Priestia aryabhattai]|uniref:RQC-minor-2 family DNA-binding protein n=1 Tax=Priestia flexa TaxID=86664 RepID=UPI000BA0FD0A|nr:RQC-minor-2 family DNA-binding protein [Priestia flexa]MDT2046959.1 RQC-minor-2 family DNA-binding protein [Priestia flexa]OZT14449.1 hypothetical protein CHN50_02450 [Priestia aryabhattai]USY56906.1 hypothetical protein NIZ91_09745 [Bacillus sp. 1780r2a1]
MAVPENLSIQFEDYPQLTFIPLGRKNKTVRSLSTKKTKALLTRLNEAVSLALQTYSIDEQLLLNSFLYNNSADGFPIPIDRVETIYPHLWKPQSFLWKDYNKNRGVPIHEHEFYPEDFSNMSKEELHSYLSKLVKEYMFCARIHDSSREEWLLHVNSRFFDHPLVSLYNRNKEAIQAMEKCENSPLLFLMNNPEKVAHFRNRLEVGLRPFRSLSYEAFEYGIKTCVNESIIQIVPDQEALLIHCSSLGLSLTYHIIDDCVTLSEEFHIVLANKRLATTQRLFKELLKENNDLICKMSKLQKWKIAAENYRLVITNINQTIQQIEQFSLHSNHVDEPPFLAFMNDLLTLDIPINEEIELSLPHFSKWNVESQITLFQKMEDYVALLNKNVIHQQLDEFSTMYKQELEQIQKGSLKAPIMVQKKPLSSLSFYKLLELIDLLKDSQAQEVYFQIVEGQSTNSMRQKGLTDLHAHGLLKNVKRKHIIEVFNQLQHLELITKNSRGFTLTPRGQQIYQLLQGKHSSAS